MKLAILYLFEHDTFNEEFLKINIKRLKCNSNIIILPNNIILEGAINSNINTVNELKKTITNNLISLLEYDKVILVNLKYVMLREIDELYETSMKCSCILSKNDYISHMIILFTDSGFIEYLMSDNDVTIENEIIYEKYKGDIYVPKNKDLPIDTYIRECYENSPIDYDEFNKWKLTRIKKYLTIYCYYEKEGYSKNQTNLQHFVNRGLNIENMDYIFIINGHICSVNIPKRDNIIVIKEDNCFDFEGWYNILQIYNWYDYQYIFFINCSVLGPLNFDSSNTIVENWIEPFIEKLNDNTVLCSNVITNVFDGPKCTSYNFLLDTRVIPYLLSYRITVREYSNCVFSKKQNRMDTILTGEYGMSIVLLKLGYNITCLHPRMSDRGELQMTLFMKNNFIDGEYRACPPINYKKCMQIIDKKIRDPPLLFSTLKCKKKGICYGNRNYDWNSKKEFYEKFGYSEEINF